MYLRRCYRNKDGKRHGYWALVESYRSSRGPRQRVVASLGEMDAADRLEAAIAELILEGKSVTYDMKPARDDPTAVGTSDVADAIIEQMGVTV